MASLTVSFVLRGIAGRVRVDVSSNDHPARRGCALLDRRRRDRRAEPPEREGVQVCGGGGGHRAVDRAGPGDADPGRPQPLLRGAGQGVGCTTRTARRGRSTLSWPTPPATPAWAAAADGTASTSPAAPDVELTTHGVPDAGPAATREQTPAAASVCCDTGTAQSCCDASAKSSCCEDTTSGLPTSCGCS